VADLSRDELRQLARMGAKSRLDEIRREEASIRRAFPELFRGRQAAADGASAGTRGGRRRRRSRMSAEARKAVSDRMKKYWAARRKAKAAK